MTLTLLILFVSLFYQITSASDDANVLDQCSLVKKYNRVLFVTAHADDIETIAGGTASLFVKCGSTVNYVITTNGDKGWSKDYNMTSDVLATIRENEALSAAAVIGVKNITFLRQEDGRLEGVDPIDLKKNITIAVRLFQPDLIITFSPELDYATYSFGLMHSDHQRTGLTTLNTVWPAARDYLSFSDLHEQGIMPWITPEIWFFAFTAPVSASKEKRVVINITGQLFEDKYNALLEHQSQYSDASAVRESLASIGSYVAENNGLSVGELAEAFIVITIL